MKKQRVLFLCVGNACRSQMAEGWLRHLAADRFEVASAGAVPSGLSQRAVQVMAEACVDISSHRSKSVDEFHSLAFDYVITVCDESRDGPCPVFLGRAGQRLHAPFDDPGFVVGTEEEITAAFRHARDEIRQWVESFISRVPRQARSHPERDNRPERDSHC